MLKRSFKYSAHTKCKKFRLCISVKYLSVLFSLIWSTLAFATSYPIAGPVVRTGSKSGITINVTPAFEILPAKGVFPLKIKINNVSGRERSWRLTLSSNDYQWNSNQTSTYTSPLMSVGNNEEKTFDLLVPLMPSHDPNQKNNFYSYLTGKLEGYGIEYNTLQFNSKQPDYTKFKGGYSNLEHSPFHIFSKELINIAGDLDKELEDHNLLFAGSTNLDLKQLPYNWRALSGVDGLWVSDQEWFSLSPEQSNAIMSWVRMGGNLFVLYTIQTQALESAFSDLGLQGLGKVNLIASQGYRVLAEDISKLIIASKRFPLGNLGDATKYIKDWGLAQGMTMIALSTVLVIIFMIAYSMLVGPINFYVFATKKHLLRLYWTTPLIALTVSLLMGLVIVLGDGLGGQGRRLIMVYLIPKIRQALVVQEQISKAGLLFNREFEINSQTNIVPLPVMRPGNSKYAAYSTAYYNGFMHSSFQTGENKFSGDYFVSRKTSANLLEGLVNTRADIYIEKNSSGRRVISRINTILGHFYYRDSDGVIWRATKVVPGESAKLNPVTEDIFEKWISQQKTNLGAATSALLENSANQFQFFYASAGYSKDFTIETLPSIIWSNDSTLFLGPIVEEEKL